MYCTALQLLAEPQRLKLPFQKKECLQEDMHSPSENTWILLMHVEVVHVSMPVNNLLARPGSLVHLDNH